MKIWYSNPWSSKLNIGGAINDFCRLIQNPEDWIVIQDGDICYLTSDWGKRIEDAIALDGDKFGLIGCYTNRVKDVRNCYGGEFSNDMDMWVHSQIASTCKSEGVEEIDHIVPGYFMAFQKKTFDLVGGFVEDSITADVFFNRAVKLKGLKKGMIRSLYVWHSYRLWASDPWDIEGMKHLQK